jgi:hypothetical protein
MSFFLVAFVAQRLITSLFVVRAEAHHWVHGCAVVAPEATTLAMTERKRISLLFVAVITQELAASFLVFRSCAHLRVVLRKRAVPTHSDITVVAEGGVFVDGVVIFVISTARI